MIIETKFNIGDRVYYGDENTCNEGRVVDIQIVFFDKRYSISYKVDTQVINEKDRYREFNELSINSSPNELLQMQIMRCERQIAGIKDRIEEIKKRINNGK